MRSPQMGATFTEVVTFQPANRCCTLHWYELEIFVGAAVILAAPRPGGSHPGKSSGALSLVRETDGHD
jgi:hypothetical protein